MHLNQQINNKIYKHNNKIDKYNIYKQIHTFNEKGELYEVINHINNEYILEKKYNFICDVNIKIQQISYYEYKISVLSVNHIPDNFYIHCENKKFFCNNKQYIKLPHCFIFNSKLF